MHFHQQFSEKQQSWNINFHSTNRMWAQPCHNYLNPLVRKEGEAEKGATEDRADKTRSTGEQICSLR